MTTQSKRFTSLARNGTLLSVPPANSMLGTCGSVYSMRAPRSRLPRQVEGIDRDTVSAEAGARVERHEAERLRGCGADDFPNVDLEPRAHERQLVHQADVDAAERVLEQLHHLRHLRRADRDH